MALGVLIQSLGPSQCPVAYLSKVLDTTSQRWSPCLRALAATALLTEEASKLTMGQPLTVYTPHQVLDVFNSKAFHWISDSRIHKYQAFREARDVHQILYHPKFCHLFVCSKS